MASGEIWNYFHKIDEHFVSCLICGIKLRKAANRSTKTFWNHLNNAHSDVYSQTDRARIGELVGMSTNMVSISSGEINFLDQSMNFDESSSCEIKPDSNFDGSKNETEEEVNNPQFNHYIEYRKVYKEDAGNIQALNQLLVKEVEKYPCLYDFNHNEYKNTVLRQQSWEKIACFMKRTNEFVRVRWKTLRDRFKKEQNRIQTGEVSPNGVLWPHYHDMLFLLPFVKDRPNPPIPISPAIIDSQMYEDGSHLNEPIKSATTSILDFANNVMRSQEQMKDLLNSNSDNDLVENEQKFSEMMASSSGSTPSSYVVANSDMKTPIATFSGPKNYIVRVTKNEYADSYESPQPDIDYYPPMKQPKLPTLEDEDHDNEDSLFCRIIMKKLKKMDEHRKEMAKAKILETLVQVQYG